MNTKKYHELFRYLMGTCCMLPDEILFVGDILEWCEENGISETDKGKPFKLISRNSGNFMMLIKEDLTDAVMEERIRALSIRSQLNNVAADRADLLNTDKKRLAYLFLGELASKFPDIQDERLADNWAFDEMERLGFFKS
jgi:hypothetical protein